MLNSNIAEKTLQCVEQKEEKPGDAAKGDQSKVGVFERKKQHYMFWFKLPCASFKTSCMYTVSFIQSFKKQDDQVEVSSS